MRNEGMSFKGRAVAWVHQHPRAVGVGLTVSAVALLGIAVVLGWSMFTRVQPPAAGPGLSSEPSPSAVPTSSAGATPIRPTPPSAPSASPSVSTGFQYGDILRVEVNRLAVREAPMLSSRLLQGDRVVGVPEPEPLGDVRLNAGDFVSVYLGPLSIGDTVWYLVWPAEDARLGYSTVSWDTVPPAGGSRPGWVAASVGEDQYLTLYRRSEPSEIGESFLMVSGTGDFESGPLPRHDLWGFNWAVALNDHPSPCAFSVTLVPEEGAEPVLAVETSTTDVEQGPVTGPGSQIGMPWGPSAGGSWDSFTVSVSSGCTWAVGLWLHGHD